MKYWISTVKWTDRAAVSSWKLRPATEAEVALHLLGGNKAIKVEECVSPGNCNVQFCDGKEGFIIISEEPYEKATEYKRGY